MPRLFSSSKCVGKALVHILSYSKQIIVPIMTDQQWLHRGEGLKVKVKVKVCQVRPFLGTKGFL